MAKPASDATPVAPPAKIDIVGGILSYLVPGLGQMSQGRFRKGLLFFVCLHGLFFYGMYLGQWQNVFLPEKSAAGQHGIKRARTVLTERATVIGQLGIGISAWPALIQFYYADEDGLASDDRRDEKKVRFHGFQKEPSIDRLNTIQREFSREWDLGMVYTVIAGVLNLLVIYDAFAGPAFREVPSSKLLPPTTPAARPGTPPSPAVMPDARTVPTPPEHPGT